MSSLFQVGNDSASNPLEIVFGSRVLSLPILILLAVLLPRSLMSMLPTMNPLSPLALLTADINHEHVVVTEGEDGLRDTDCPCTSVNDVLFVWYVRWLEQTVEVGEVVQKAG